MMPTLITFALFLILGLLGFAYREFLKGLIVAWVKADFDRDLEDYKSGLAAELERYKAQLKRHEQAAEIAELLACSSAGVSDDKKMNELIWRASLWLPAHVVHDLSECLVNSGKKSPKDVLIAVRKVLHGPDDPLRPEQIAHMEKIPQLFVR